MAPKVSGIYQIICTVSKKVWVGQAIDIHKRWSGHRAKLRQGRNSPHLQAAWDLYGSQAFVFSILEVCEANSLDARETYWIKTMKSSDRDYGYNIEPTPRGTGPRAEEAKMRMRGKQRGNTKGLVWWHDPLTNGTVRLPKDVEGPTGWVRGRGPRERDIVDKIADKNRGKVRDKEARENISAGLKGKPSPLAGRVAITNGVEDRYVEEGSVIPLGWSKGKSCGPERDQTSGRFLRK